MEYASALKEKSKIICLSKIEKYCVSQKGESLFFLVMESDSTLLVNNQSAI